MLKQLRNDLKETNEKIDALQQWIKEHTQHPDFLKIVRDRNHLSVKVMELEFKINQLENGLPILGEAEEFTTVQLEQRNHQIMKN